MVSTSAGKKKEKMDTSITETVCMYEREGEREREREREREGEQLTQIYNSSLAETGTVLDHTSDYSK